MPLEQPTGDSRADAPPAPPPAAPALPAGFGSCSWARPGCRTTSRLPPSPPSTSRARRRVSPSPSPPRHGGDALRAAASHEWRSPGGVRGRRATALLHPVPSLRERVSERACSARHRPCRASYPSRAAPERRGARAPPTATRSRAAARFARGRTPRVPRPTSAPVCPRRAEAPPGPFLTSIGRAFLASAEGRCCTFSPSVVTRHAGTTCGRAIRAREIKHTSSHRQSAMEPPWRCSSSGPM